MAEQLGKDPSDFSEEKNERFKFEQKPIGIDAFNKLEEKKKKRKNWKKKTKKTWIGWKKQGTKTKKREREQEKIEQEELWDKPNTLKKEFRAIGNIKKKSQRQY